MSRIDERLEVMKVDTAEMTKEQKFSAATGLTFYDEELANNEWYVPVMTAAGPSSDEDREFALGLFNMYRTNIQNVAYDMDESVSSTDTAPSVDTDATEF